MYETTAQESPAQRENPPPEQSGQPVTGYVLKMYPRFSETFIVSEILAREAAGERIVIFSLRPSTDTRFHSELARVQAPVIQVPRTSTAGRFWQQLQQAAGQQNLAEGLQQTLPELLTSEHDDTFQGVALAQLALQHRVTHLHAHFASVATTVARLAGRIAGLPYSFTAHAKDIFHETVDPAQLQHKLAEAHHAVTISQYNMNHLHQCFPQATARLHLVRNGLELSRFRYAPQREHAGDVPRILGVGRLVEKKGFHLLVDAVARLHAQGIRARADIVGEGPEAEPLARRIAAHGLEDHIRLLGARTQAEVTALLGSHDLFAAPFVVGADGNTDGLPTVLLEAMARGIPCVAGDVTAVGEVIRHRPDGSPETGWLVPSGDVAALTAALAVFSRTPAAGLRQITDAARALVEEQFSSARQAQQLQDLCHSGTGAHAPAATGQVTGQATGQVTGQATGQAAAAPARRAEEPSPVPALAPAGTDAEVLR